MTQPYFPRADSSALAWTRNFAAGIASDPRKFSLTEEDAQAISAAVEAFADAYRLTVDPATATPVATVAKNQARCAAESLCRRYVGLIKPDWRVSDADKIALGVPPPRKSGKGTPVHVPQSAPLLKITGFTGAGAGHELRVSDSASPCRIAKPSGAAELQLFVAVADDLVRDPEQARFRGVITRNIATVGFEHSEGGKTATYFARWSGPRGDVGPWSSPVSMMIAA